MSGPAPVIERSFRLAPQWRRIGVFLLVSGPVIGAVAVLTGLLRRHFLQVGFFVDAPARQVAALALVTAIPLFTGLFICTWKLHVNGRGLARRRLWRWDEWPWEAFQSGQVQQGSTPGTFVRPRAPPWDRWLSVEFLDADDRSFLIELCAARLPLGTTRRPASSEVPDRVRFYDAATLTRRVLRMDLVELDSVGIEIVQGESRKSWGYGGVTVQLVHERRDRSDLTTFELEIDGRTIRPHPRFMHFDGERVRWSRATLSTVERFLRKYVPPNRVIESYSQGEPRTVPEVLWRAGVVRRRQQFETAICAVLAAVFLPQCAMIFRNWRRLWADVSVRSDTAAVVLLVVAVLLILPLGLAFAAIHVWRTRARELEDLQKWRVKLESGGKFPSTPVS